MAENRKWNQELNQSEYKRLQAEAGITYVLARFGDYLAEREDYRSCELRGLKAVRFYLMQKHHWTPATVEAMSHEHLEFAMLEERADWTLPPEAAPE